MWKEVPRIAALSAALIALAGLAPAQVATPPRSGSLSALWTYTTGSHFSVYGALAGQPIYREEIRGTALRPDRVILALIPPGHAGLRLLCLNRRDGSEVWRRDLPGEITPMSREFPTTDDRVFLALYHSSSRSVAIVAVDLVSGGLLWQRDAEVTLARYQYGDLLEIDTAKGLLNLYLPEASRNNRVTISMDGSRIRHFSYRGYFWPTGTRRHGNLIFGFEGEPLSMTARTALALDESTGIVRWRIPAAGHWTSPPTVANDVLLIATKTELQAVDLPSGRRRWTVGLRGQVPPEPSPPVVIKDHIVLAQQLHGKAPPHADWIFTRHLFTTGTENGLVPLGQRSMGPTFMRRVGPLLISEGGLWLDVVDPAIPVLRSATSFEATFSRFSFATPGISLGSADDQGFLVATTDGKLRYYNAPSPD